MKVIVTIAGIDPKYGGPSKTVPALGEALSSAGISVHLITLSGKSESTVSAIEDCRYKQTMIQSSSARFRSLDWARAFRQALVAAVAGNESVLLYDVGLWLPSNHLVSQFARRSRIPLVISPRGMLSPTALKVSRWRKRIAWRLYQRRDLCRARAYHATSSGEVADIRARGLRAPIAVVPNGVDLPVECRKAEIGDRKPNTRIALFLSRLHPIKGLADLVIAWAQVRPVGWRVVIAGPDEAGHKAEIEALIHSFRLEANFEFIGPIAGDSKAMLYRSAELFVLPSYSESFGQVVAEALAAGVPVITTQSTPWHELESCRCGWWIPNGVDALTGALRHATSISDAERFEMGHRGRALVERHYSWTSAAQRMIAAYTWLLHGGQKPHCIHV